MSSSIYSSIRGSKTQAAVTAEQYSGDRLWEPTSQICPTRTPMSYSGVMDVPYDSIITQIAGCYDPSDRINIENSLRPDYSAYLNTDGITGEGVVESNRLSSSRNSEQQHNPSYDTFLGISGFVRPILPTMQLQQSTTNDNSKMSSVRSYEKDIGYELMNVKAVNQNRR